MSSKEPTREELLDLILANNMLEKFVEWLRLKGIDNDVISLRDIDQRYLYEFAAEKKLLVDENEPTHYFEDSDQALETILEKKIAVDSKPRKIRRKT